MAEHALAERAASTSEPGRRDRDRLGFLVWIDAREAIVVCPEGPDRPLERLTSEVPAHRRSTGHVRHDPTVRHGGGIAQAAVEAHRLEHLARFLDRVVGRLMGPDGDWHAVEIVGPGEVREHLARRLRDADARHHRPRSVESQPAARLTDRQLLARWRARRGRAPDRAGLGGPATRMIRGRAV